MATGVDASEVYSHYVAIDFGTAGSSLAFSTSSSEEIHLQSEWQKTTKRTGVDTKVPTVLLLNPRKEFEQFGDDAIHVYHTKNVKFKEQIDDYYYFDRFKMSLHNEDPEQNMYRSFTVEAKNGKKLPAIEVISILLNHFGKVFSEKYKSLRRTLNWPKITRIKWVITIPAIWSLAAKQLMKRAAEEAELVDKKRHDSLIFALEPEAAAIYCDKQLSKIPQVSSPGSEKSYYLIADCGGGTVDMAVHKLTKYSNGEIKIKELAHVQGAALGGFAVNDQFEDAFLKMCKLSKEDATDMKTKYPRDWTKLIDEFEICKSSNDTKTERTVSIPKKIRNFIKDKSPTKSMKDLIDSYTTYKFKYSLDDSDESDESDDPDVEDLVVPFATLCALFSFVIEGICEKIEEALQKSPKCKKIQTIILVGGFATCDLLYTTVKSRFSPPMEVIKGNKPELSVLRGAVIYGKQEGIRFSRKMPYTVGVKASVPYREEVHKDRKEFKHTYDGKEHCDNVFWQLVLVNDQVKAGDLATYTFRPASRSDNSSVVMFYATKTEEFVKYVDDERLFKLGECTIKDLPKEDSGKCREITLTVDFSSTEGIIVLATSENSQEELPLSMNLWKSDDLFLQ